MVISHRHKDPYRAFFTTDEAIGDYMASLLDLKEGDALLEPAAGDGHLIAAARQIEPRIGVTAYELHPEYSANLRRRFAKADSVEVYERDTILCPDLDLRETFGPKFTKIIANPPYGGWQEHERRADLKKKFPGFYVRETYSLFLLRSLRLLEEGGKLVFIIPATLLYLNLHSALRRLILEDYTCDSIDIFKSDLFPGVAFGYADLCIIGITARRPSPSHSLRLRFVDSLDEFSDANHVEAKSSFLIQKDLLRVDGCAIPLSPPNSALRSCSGTTLQIGDIAKCVTGFYSGNDRRFLRIANRAVKRAADYEIVDERFIERDPSEIPHPLDGIEGERAFIPILKGGGFNFVKPPLWFVDWSQSAVQHYKSDKKARFQNPTFYFKKGVGFPMVTSSRPTAALIQNSLFDQSIVGIFPTGDVSLEFLLAYCNSCPFWKSLKAVNPSANNSAKYVLRTPIHLPDKETQDDITTKTKELLDLLVNRQRGSELLMTEILNSIDEYTNDKP